MANGSFALSSKQIKTFFRIIWKVIIVSFKDILV